MASSRLLIVDDDPKLRQFLRQELELEGYDCQDVANAQDALIAIRQGSWDLLLLDWSLPDFSGIEVCRRIRQTQDITPILMLTARDDVKERVDALDAGADDYLTKPFSIEELLARIRAHLRRGAHSAGVSQDVEMIVSDLRLNPSSREVWRGGELIALSGKEFDLLQLLIGRPNYVHERRSILSAIWGDGWVGDSNVLDVYIRALRRKIERPGASTLIHTVRGIGFILKEGAVKD